MDVYIRLAIEVAALAITLGTVLWKLSTAVTTFQLIGTQQAKELVELKLNVKDLQSAVVEMISLSAQMTRLSDTLSSQGKRVDEVERRFNFFMDRPLSK